MIRREAMTTSLPYNYYIINIITLNKLEFLPASIVYSLLQAI